MSHDRLEARRSYSSRSSACDSLLQTREARYLRRPFKRAHLIEAEHQRRQINSDSLGGFVPHLEAYIKKFEGILNATVLTLSQELTA